MKKIGIVSCDKWVNKIIEDKLLQACLVSCGYNAEIISWEDESCDYSEYSALILKSVWGYQNKYREFKNWLMKLKENNVLLLNNPDLILNNIRKDKQFEILTKNNIDHIDTKFIYDIDELIKYISDNEEVVLKPIISGSGEKTIKVDSNNLTSEDLEMYREVLNIEDNGIMVQPFIEEIKDGEFACIYIDGKNTHTMLRFPGIFVEKQKPRLVYDVPEEVKKLADEVANIDEFKDYLYMRVDIVLNNNKPTVMEVELAEPDLLFKYISDEEIKKEGVEELSKQLIRRVRR